MCIFASVAFFGSRIQNSFVDCWVMASAPVAPEGTCAQAANGDVASCSLEVLGERAKEYEDWDRFEAALEAEAAARLAEEIYIYIYTDFVHYSET